MACTSFLKSLPGGDDDLTFLFRCGNHALPFWIRLSAERMTVQA